MRYEIVKIRYDMFYVMEDNIIIFKFSTLEQAQKKVEQLEYVNLLTEMMTYQ